MVLMGIRIEFRNRVEHREPSTYSALHIDIVGFGPSEIGHNPVAQIVGNMSAEAVDLVSGATMIVDKDLAPLFGIALRRQARRIYRSQNSTVKCRLSPNPAKVTGDMPNSADSRLLGGSLFVCFFTVPFRMTTRATNR